MEAGYIKHLIERHYSGGGWRVFYEVANDTGTRANRHIDVLVCGIWPSTGHHIIGIEIKVSRGDFKRELANPAKAQDLMRYCDRWYLACPAGLVKPDEVPATWGIMEAFENIKIKRQAPALSPEPLSPGFVMAVLRQNETLRPADAVEHMAAARTAELSKTIEERIESGISARVRDNSSRTERANAVADKVKELTGTELKTGCLTPSNSPPSIT